MIGADTEYWGIYSPAYFHHNYKHGERVEWWTNDRNGSSMDNPRAGYVNMDLGRRRTTERFNTACVPITFDDGYESGIYEWAVRSLCPRRER